MTSNGPGNTRSSADKPQLAATPARRRRSLVRRLLRWIGLVVMVILTGLVVDGWKAFGHRAQGARRARMEQSPQWSGGCFRNPQPLVNDMLGATLAALETGQQSSPKEPLPFTRMDRKQLASPPTTGLRVTWFGHSSLLVEIDGHRILTDPVWSERVSPFSWIGPRRWYPALAELSDLTPLDAVVISHDHYDHLDYPTITAMKDFQTTFVVPLGVGAHLEYWGVPAARILELDWWESTRVRDLEIIATPARHASGRVQLFGKDETLWAGFALRGARHRVWYSGDTGLFPALREIGERLGPFDLTMIEAGAYGRWWPDWHLGPEQAIQAHTLVKGRVMVPAHWGLLTLAFHGWTEPAERLLVAAQKASVALALPRPGQSFEPEAAPPTSRWWPDTPWKSAEQDPIVSGGMN